MIKAGFDLVGVNKQCYTCAVYKKRSKCKSRVAMSGLFGEARSCVLVGRTFFREMSQFVIIRIKSHH